MKLLLVFIYIFLQLFLCSNGILYPKESESREVKSLDGIWSFRVAPNERKEFGFVEKWYKYPLEKTGEIELMPVPSSFNDITQNKEIRDHIGWVWYSTQFWIPSRWKDDKNIFVRFGSANYHSVVWINGEHLLNHTGGYLPFQGDMTKMLKFGKNNLLVLALNNTLTPLTIPQGTLTYPNDHSRYPDGFTIQSYNFDYFNFAGIHRPVYVHTTPSFYIDDITINTKVENDGLVEYKIDYKYSKENSLNQDKEVDCKVLIRNENGVKVALGRGLLGTLKVENPKLWWPYLSAPKGENPGYLYTLEVHLASSSSIEEDIYRLKFGIRSLEINETTLLVNGKPFYFHGFGRHEDYNIRGRGVDFPSIVKDHNLLKWIGANSYRTSHYPYAEEILDLTDQLGIVIIDESPAIGLTGFNQELMNSHIQVMKELVQRDKNRPSVLVWSIGNEPKSMEKASTLYFERVINETRLVDPGKRPITIVINAPFADNINPGVDIISQNKYFGWYGDTGRTEVIAYQIPTDVKENFNLYKKPVLITEYGAGSISGMHQSPSFTWTEDFQVDYLLEHFKAFDSLRKCCPYFLGEMIWNFADFATPQETFRPWGCMKGVFTRERQPKRAAHIVRYRYFSISNETDQTCAN